jgi:hypothetical protein
MSKPGFYNDNEYRAYPFLDEADAPRETENINPLPQEAIVDAGFIFSLGANYDDAAHFVFLRQATASAGVLQLKFATTAFCTLNNAFLQSEACVNHDLVFTRHYELDETTDTPRILDAEWATEYAESAITDGCTNEPLWSGFLVTGKLDALLAAVLEGGGSLTFAGGVADPYEELQFRAMFFYIVEAARIQNLRKGYLRSISIGNYARTAVPVCTDDPIPQPENPCESITPPEIIPHATCLQGHIFFKEGYNTRITQNDRVNTLTFTAEKGAGASADNNLCETFGEVPLYAAEINAKPLIYNGTDTTPEKRSEFLSGGWSCNDLIFTLNGVGGSNINIVGGKNIDIGYDDVANKITIKLSENARGKCND